MRRILAFVSVILVLAHPSLADTTPQTLPFAQDWTNAGLITTSDDWSGVPGIIGYRGDNLATVTGTDPQTILADGTATPVDVNANQANPNTFTTGGVSEFAIANPVVALQGSGTADAPFLLITLNTTGQCNINVAYNLRDIDGSADNAVQPVALHYRVGNSGNFTNLAAGFVADASTGPSLATQVTPVSVALPLAAENQALVQLRIMTTDAAGSDEWIGVDDINVTAGSCGPLPNLSIADISGAEGNTGTTPTFTFIVQLSGPAPAGGVTFDIATANNTATSGSDYGATTFTGQTITAGNTSFSFPVAIVGDDVVEADETFFVNVTNVTGAVVTDGQAVGTITNDDVATLTIPQIQGSGLITPFAGQTVRTSGIVTGQKTNGFFIQSAIADSDPNTSEGLFVFTGAAPTVLVGDLVQAQGTAVEFFELTELQSSNANVSVTSSGNPLPAPVVLTSTILDPAGTPTGNLEKFEGMRLTGSFTTNAPTESFGETWTVLTGTPRAFREPGIEISVPPPPGAPAGVPRFDENPERLMIDSDGLAGKPSVSFPSPVPIGTITGPLDFTFSNYKLLPETPLTPIDRTFDPVRAGTSDELTVASFNIENFGPGLGASQFASKIDKGSLVIRNVLRYPDIIGMVEVEDQAALDALVARVNLDAVGDGQNPQYVGYLIEANGTDVDNDQDVAFIVKTSRVTVVSVQQGLIGGVRATYVEPTTGNTAILNDREPLILRATIQRSPMDPVLPVTVIVNHLRSLIDVAQDPGDGPRVREKRRKQAEYLANLVQSLRAAEPNILLVGDFNAFQFNDGYVDGIGTIKGQPTPDTEVTLASSDLVDPNLIDLVLTLPAAERYSFIFEGNPQVLDHIIITPEVQALLNEFDIARNNADFPDTLGSILTRPERISDHDLPVVFLGLPVGANDPPVNTVPGPQGMPENGTLLFSTANGNAISISDPDAGTAGVQVTLGVTAGTLTLPSVAGLTFSAGDGIADATMTFTGSIASINAALEGLQFNPPAAFSGGVTLTITTNDQGNAGTGVPRSDTDTVSITVSAAIPTLDEWVLMALAAMLAAVAAMRLRV